MSSAPHSLRRWVLRDCRSDRLVRGPLRVAELLDRRSPGKPDATTVRRPPALGAHRNPSTIVTFARRWRSSQISGSRLVSRPVKGGEGGSDNVRGRSADGGG